MALIKKHNRHAWDVDHLPPEYREQIQRQKKDHARRVLKAISPWRVLLLVICLGVFVFAVVNLICYYTDAINSQQTSAQLRSEYQKASANNDNTPTEAIEPPSASPDPTRQPAPEVLAEAALEPTFTQPQATKEVTDNNTASNSVYYPGNPKWVIRDSVQEIRRSNREIIGWLSIPGIIEEAVVQRDNTYYLTHDSLGKRNITGAIFLDENCNLRSVPDVLLLHGHNMKTGQMFGILKHYKVNGSSYLRAHSRISLETMFEKSEYTIFSVMEVETTYGEAQYLDFFSRFTFSSADEFNTFVRKSKGLSMYSSDLDVQYGDRLLILATCTGNDDTMRLLILARKIRDNEDMIELSKAELSMREK